MYTQAPTTGWPLVASTSLAPNRAKLGGTGPDAFVMTGPGKFGAGVPAGVGVGVGVGTGVAVGVGVGGRLWVGGGDWVGGGVWVGSGVEVCESVALVVALGAALVGAALVATADVCGALGDDAATALGDGDGLGLANVAARHSASRSAGAFSFQLVPPPLVSVRAWVRHSSRLP